MRHDHLDRIYHNRIAPFIPDGQFSMGREEIAEFKLKLGKCVKRHKRILEDACATFIDTAVFEVRRGRKIELAQYASEVAETCNRLAKLLRKPKDYAAIHNTLLNNWGITRQRTSLDRVAAITDELEIIAADILRVAADHSSGKVPRGDVAFVEFMLLLRWVAEDAGAKMELPGNEDVGYSSPLRDFAVAVLQFAIQRGKLGADSVELHEDVRKEMHGALDRYLEEMVPLITEYLRPLEKRMRRRKSPGRTKTAALAE
jgi:hypothetical protein